MKKELNYDVIIRAIHNEPEALTQVLEHYDTYITALCTYEVIDRKGEKLKRVDEDMKVQLQVKLINAIEKWKVAL